MVHEAAGGDSSRAAHTCARSQSDSAGRPHREDSFTPVHTTEGRVTKTLPRRKCCTHQALRAANSTRCYACPRRLQPYKMKGMQRAAALHTADWLWHCCWQLPHALPAVAAVLSATRCSRHARLHKEMRL